MSSKYNNLVRELVKRSSNDHGVVEETLVRDVLSGLKEGNPGPGTNKNQLN